LAKYTGRGAEIQVRTVDSPETWQTIAQVRRIGAISQTADEIEVTTLDTVGDFRDFLPSFKDPGELPVELIWDPALASHGATGSGFYALFQSGDTKTFRIKIPVNPVQYLRVTGFLRDFELPEYTADDPLAVTGTIRLGGTPTLGAS
jgi:hypothetical protein